MLRLGRHSFPDGALLIMAIVNRTPDSFYDRGATYAFDKALERVAEVVAAGAEIVDIGGVKAAPGDEVDAEEEIGAPPISWPGPADYPDLLISVDTWRHEVGRVVCQAGRNCSTTPGATMIPGWPRRPRVRRRARMYARLRGYPAHRAAPDRYDDVFADVLAAHRRGGRTRGVARSCGPEPGADRPRATTSARTPGIP